MISPFCNHNHNNNNNVGRSKTRCKVLHNHLIIVGSDCVPYSQST